MIYSVWRYAEVVQSSQNLLSRQDHEPSMNWVSESLSSILLPPEISGASANCCNHAGITPGPFQISFLLIEAGWIEQERLLSNPSDNIDKVPIHIGMGRAFDI